MARVAGDDVEVLASGYKLAEAPRVAEDGSVWFADALGGALYRQKKAAVELMRDISIMQGREDAAEARGIMRASNRVPNIPNAQAVANTPSILPGVPDSYNKQFQGIGDVLDDLTKGIQLDEGTAADHSIAATSGC